MDAWKGFSAAVLLTTGLAIAPTARAQRTAETTTVSDAARANVDDVIRQSGAEVAVAYHSLTGNQELFIHADKEFPATDQWVEIAVMIDLYAAVQTRALRWDDTLVVENNFPSAAGRRAYHLDPGRDHDPEFYRQIGHRVTLRELCRHMMTRNSQLAANTLIQRLSIAGINLRMAELGRNGFKLQHAFQDTQAEKSGLSNTASARGMMEVLWALATNAAVSSQASKEMIGLLANSRTSTSGPFAGELTSGSADGNYQEALIVYGAHSFAAVVVVHGLDPGPAGELIGKISHTLSRAN